MSPSRGAFFAKLAYGFLFVGALPALLIFWAHRMESVVRLPIEIPREAGGVLAIAGVVVMVVAMITLRILGGGLPMNAFPPERHVARGIYRWLPHPIYVGFCVTCAGVSILEGSAAGLWLVTPVVALGTVALVFGFEKPDLAARFGPNLPKPRLRLPEDRDDPPTAAERLAVYFVVFLPWLLAYEAVRILGVPPDAVEVYLPFERHLPVVEWAEVFYAATYPFALAVPLVAPSARLLRRFAVAGLVATAAGNLLFLVVPAVAPPRPFVPDGMLGRLLLWERAHDTPAAAFPSFHVAWAFLAASVWARALRSVRVVPWVVAVAMAASCVMTGMHATIDVVAGAALALLAWNAGAVWEWMRAATERIANSWREWKLGPVRFINHGVYAGVGTFLGLSAIGVLLGPARLAEIFSVALAGLVAAGLWAQFVEGSPSLLRPYGYYGGVLGVVAASGVVQLVRGDAWPLLAGFALAGPVIQATGRLRCLVQGCCHGREANARVGIRYLHPRSRVCRLAHLTGVPIHPTPLYSILGNVATGAILFRLWAVEAPLPLICGLYLILNGLARFVEEAYRGEPQTPRFGGLAVYHYMAIASVLSGIGMTMIRTEATFDAPELTWGAIGVAALFGVVATAGLGLDFPESNRRFSRLV